MTLETKLVENKIEFLFFNCIYWIHYHIRVIRLITKHSEMSQLRKCEKHITGRHGLRYAECQDKFETGEITPDEHFKCAWEITLFWTRAANKCTPGFLVNAEGPFLRSKAVVDKYGERDAKYIFSELAKIKDDIKKMPDND